MARVKFYLDTRPTKDGKCHIKMSISHNGTTALMPTGVFVRKEHWNFGDSETEPHVKKTCDGYKALNSILSDKFNAVQQNINELVLNGTINSYATATHIKNHIQDKLDGKNSSSGMISSHFENFINRRNKPGTANLYRETLVKIAKYHDITRLIFEDIKNFENMLRKDGLAVNTVARHMRDIRAIYNDAIDYNIVSLASYPFRRFKITHEATAKRALSLEQLRTLRDYPCEPFQEKYRDFGQKQCYFHIRQV